MVLYDDDDDDITPTHPDFKSIIPHIPDANVMEEYLGYALAYQYMFSRRTTPWEKASWDDEELNNFQVNLEVIDRLYHIHHYDDNCSGQEFEFVGRMIFKGKPLYIEVIANCDYTGFECQGQGYIFISKDANLFMKTLSFDKMDRSKVYQSLREDGIYYEEVKEEDVNIDRLLRKNAPMLKFLCHEAIYEHRKLLKNDYKEKLPKLLRSSVKDFIRTKKSRLYYDQNFDFEEEIPVSDESSDEDEEMDLEFDPKLLINRQSSNGEGLDFDNKALTSRQSSNNDDLNLNHKSSKFKQSSHGDEDLHDKPSTCRQSSIIIQFGFY